METIKEIRESGLLELYVMGLLSGEELQQVEQAIGKFPELKSDLQSIEQALFQYSKTTQLTPSPHIKKELLQKITNNVNSTSSTKIPGSSGIWKLLSLFGLFIASTLAYLYFSQDTRVKDLEKQYAALENSCDSISTSFALRLELLEQLQNPNKQVAFLNATDKYPSTSLNLVLNAADKKAFIQAINLPELTADQSFQLWSLKENQDPIPLDVFQIGNETIFEVAYEDGTQNYAITIEPKGGSQSPTLENLIGVIPVG